MSHPKEELVGSKGNKPTNENHQRKIQITTMSHEGSKDKHGFTLKH
jgi:hypothetical protein